MTLLEPHTRTSDARADSVFVSSEWNDLFREVTARMASSADAHSLPLGQGPTRAERVRREAADSLTVVAHELRNPLAPIRAAAALLGHAAPEELPRLQTIIERQVTRMTRLIADLLDVSRAEEGKLKLRREIVDMRAIVAEAVDNCRPAMSARSQRLKINLPPTPLDMDGDAGRLVQVVSNLLDNASKYTPPGGVVRVSVAATDDELRLIVSDNGIGVSAQALPHLFERYVKEAHAVDFNGVGVGIGLALVRELVQAHGGTVGARSAGLGQGSRFVVKLPRHGSEPGGAMRWRRCSENCPKGS